MTQMATRAGTSSAPTGVVTVADLLTRYAPDPMVEAEPATAPVSVGSLLRREGRAPHAPDRPLAPRSRSDEEPAPRRGSGAFVRRSVIAAGTLLAAGSVFGATVVMDSSSTGAVGGPRDSGGYAGEGRLDLPPGQDGAIPTVVDTAAQTGALDAGDAPPMSWRDVAFPGGGNAPAGDRAAAPGTVRAPSGGTATDDGPVAGQGDGSGRPGASDTDTRSGNPGNGNGSTGNGSTGNGNSGDGRSDDRGSGVGTAVQDLGDGVGGPVGGVVGGLGGAVSDVGDAVEGDEPSVIGSLAGSLLG